MSLFDEPAALPNGLLLAPDFIDPLEERELLRRVRALPMHEARFKQFTARRRVASFGGSYDFETNALGPAPPIPAWLEPLRAKAAAWLAVPPAELTHAMVSEYRPGTPLGWHRDVPQFELVFGVSLAGPARMRFRPWPPRRGAPTYDLDLAPRAAYVLRGEVRWRWQHAIAPTPALRYSITFRTASGR